MPALWIYPTLPPENEEDWSGYVTACSGKCAKKAADDIGQRLAPDGPSDKEPSPIDCDNPDCPGWG